MRVRLTALNHHLTKMLES